MKICIECNFCQPATQMTQHGEQTFLVCTSPDCRDPVNGDPVPCNFARRETGFCGLIGRYWTEKKLIEVAKVIDLVKG